MFYKSVLELHCVIKVFEKGSVQLFGFCYVTAVSISVLISCFFISRDHQSLTVAQLKNLQKLLGTRDKLLGTRLEKVIYI